MARLTLIVDADSFAYRAAAKFNETFDWGDGVEASSGQLDFAKESLDDHIEKIRKKLGAKVVVMTLSSYEHPWRLEVLPTYKQNRKDMLRPVLLGPMKDYVREKYKAIEKPSLEGDDVCGILLTHPTAIPGPKVCVSMDKDLRTVPGHHYNFNTDEEFDVTPEGALRWHMTQALAGDPTDGYKGCPGIGYNRAGKALEPCKTPRDYWEAVVSCYASKGLTEADALVQARVARICQWRDFDYINRRVILWNPPNPEEKCNGP